MLNSVKRNALFWMLTASAVSIILYALCAPRIAGAGEVTVNLVWKFPDAGWVEIEPTQGQYSLRYNDKVINLEPGQSFKAARSSLTPFIIINNDIIILEKREVKFTAHQNGIFRVREPGKDWASYRGDLTLTAQGVTWKLANTLDQELYLKGVVPIEMSNAWASKGFEALKAQAVAARTYMLKNMDASRVITDSPNIHQAYLGRSVEGTASKAVEDTSGQVLVDKTTGELISVYYSSHNGGHTEETQNVWKNHDPHYPSFADPFSVGVGGYVDNWKFYIAADELGKAFGLAPVRTVNLEKLASGRVYRVDLEDWMGNKKSVSGGEFVQKFYPYDRSITAESFLGRLFTVRTVAPKEYQRNLLNIFNSPGNQHLNMYAGITNEYTGSKEGPLFSRIISSNAGMADSPRPYAMYVFSGKGWGHGVGMSQWGAYNMAMKGYSYEDILLYYYRNSALLRR